MADQQKKKPKNYYVDFTKRTRYGSQHHRGGHRSGSGGNAKYKETPELTQGQRGFLITSITGYEVKCYIEIRQLLEHYYQQLYSADGGDVNKLNPGESTAKDRIDSPPEEPTAKEEDIDELETELAELRQSRRHFRQVKTQCKNVIFIVTNEECQHVDPDQMVRQIFRDIEAEKSQKTRYTFKIFPVMMTFKTSVPGVKEAVANILKSDFSNESKHESKDKEDLKYFIEIQIRGNFKLDQTQRMKMIEGLAETIAEIKPSWKVDRENADLILMVIALRDVCCVTFLMDYFKLKKYNLVEYYRNHVDEFEDLTGGTSRESEQDSKILQH